MVQDCRDDIDWCTTYIYFATHNFLAEKRRLGCISGTRSKVLAKPFGGGIGAAYGSKAGILLCVGQSLIIDFVEKETIA